MSPVKPTYKTEFLPLLFIVLAVAASFYFFATFPEQVPVHWNIHGDPDNFGSKTVGAFAIPVLMLGIYFLFLFIPYFDPKKERYSQFTKVYHAFKAMIVAYLFFIYLIASLASLGYNIRVEVWMPVLVGSMFVVLGNYMSKIKPNWFMGIRTPWTLSSEENWNKTHRFGSKVFMLGGLIMMILPWVPTGWEMTLIIAIIVAMVIGTIGFSLSYYLIKENGEKNKQLRQSNNQKDN